jgi:hypothetical protein
MLLYLLGYPLTPFLAYGGAHELFIFPNTFYLRVFSSLGRSHMVTLPVYPTTYCYGKPMFLTLGYIYIFLLVGALYPLFLCTTTLLCLAKAAERDFAQCFSYPPISLIDLRYSLIVGQRCGQSMVA